MALYGTYCCCPELCPPPNPLPRSCHTAFDDHDHFGDAPHHLQTVLEVPAHDPGWHAPSSARKPCLECLYRPWPMHHARQASSKQYASHGELAAITHCVMTFRIAAEAEARPVNSQKKDRAAAMGVCGWGGWGRAGWTRGLLSLPFVPCSPVRRRARQGAAGSVRPAAVRPPSRRCRVHLAPRQRIQHVRDGPPHHAPVCVERHVQAGQACQRLQAITRHRGCRRREGGGAAGHVRCEVRQVWGGGGRGKGGGGAAAPCSPRKHTCTWPARPPALPQRAGSLNWQAAAPRFTW